MLEYIDLHSDKVVGIRLDGKVTTEAFDRVAAEIEERLQRHDKVSLYVEVVDFTGISGEALLKDLTFGARNWRRFDKEAVVTDKRWMRQAAEGFGKLVPGIEVKAFTTAESMAAREWVKA